MVMDDIEAQKMLEDARKTRRDRSIQELLRDDEKVSMQQAKQLRKASSNGELTQEIAKQILKKTSPRAKSVSISR